MNAPVPLPGLRISGPDHWPLRWEPKPPSCRRVLRQDGADHVHSQSGLDDRPMGFALLQELRAGVPQAG